ncbi:MAG: hypothetical protein DMF89_08555 [Acidobacteria bacterium]|nr:MAG: hypothetical protein DMF89_08555 [Acidobacteriota bacterium]
MARGPSSTNAAYRRWKAVKSTSGSSILGRVAPPTGDDFSLDRARLISLATENAAARAGGAVSARVLAFLMLVGSLVALLAWSMPSAAELDCLSLAARTIAETVVGVFVR